MRVVDVRTGEESTVSIEEAERLILSGSHRLAEGTTIPVVMRAPDGNLMRAQATDVQLAQMARDGVGRALTPELLQQTQPVWDAGGRDRVAESAGLGFAAHALGAAEIALEGSLALSPIRAIESIGASVRGLASGADPEATQRALDDITSGRDVLAHARALVHGEDPETELAAIEGTQQLEPAAFQTGRIIGFGATALGGPVGPAARGGTTAAGALQAGTRNAGLRAALGGVETGAAALGGATRAALTRRLSAMVQRGAIRQSTADLISTSAGTAVQGMAAATQAELLESNLDNAPLSAQRLLASAGFGVALGGIGGAAAHVLAPPVRSPAGRILSEAEEAARVLQGADAEETLRRIVGEAASEMAVDERAYRELMSTPNLRLEDIQPSGRLERVLIELGGAQSGVSHVELRSYGNRPWAAAAERADDVVEKLTPEVAEMLRNLRDTRGALAAHLRSIDPATLTQFAPRTWSASPAGRAGGNQVIAAVMQMEGLVDSVRAIRGLRGGARTAANTARNAFRGVVEVTEEGLMIAPELASPAAAAATVSRLRRVLVEAADASDLSAEGRGVSSLFRALAGVGDDADMHALSAFGIRPNEIQSATALLENPSYFGEAGNLLHRLDDALAEHAQRDEALFRALSAISPESADRQLLTSRVGAALRSSDVEKATELSEAIARYISPEQSADEAMLAIVGRTSDEGLARQARNLAEVQRRMSTASEAWVVARNHMLAKRTKNRIMGSINQAQNFRPEMALHMGIGSVLGAAGFGGPAGAAIGAGVGFILGTLRTPGAALQRLANARASIARWRRNSFRFTDAVRLRSSRAAAGLPSFAALIPPAIRLAESENSEDRQELLVALAEMADEGASDPGLVVDRMETAIAGIHTSDPQISQEMVETFARARAAILAAMPPYERDIATGEYRFQGTAAYMADLRDTLLAVTVPEALLANVLDGSITTMQVETFSVVYPDLYEDIATAAMEGITAGEGELPLPMSIGVSRLLRFPVGQAAPLPATVTAGVQQAAQTLDGPRPSRTPRRPRRESRALTLTQRLETP